MPEALDLVVNAVIADNARRAMRGEMSLEESASNTGPAYLQLMEAIESQLDG